MIRQSLQSVQSESSLRWLRRLSREQSQKSGRHGHAYGSVGRPISRAPWSDSPGCPAEQNPQVATPQASWSGFLEPRTLMATIPAASATGAADVPDELSDVTLSGNTNNPTVVINPYNSQQVVAVWGRDLSQEIPAPTRTTAVVEGAWSNDGGASWTYLRPRCRGGCLHLSEHRFPTRR